MDIYERLKKLNIELPPPPPPGGLYSPIKYFGDKLIYTSGVGPTDSTGAAVYTGILGRDLSVEEGAAAARLATLNILGVLDAQLGDLNKIKTIETGKIRNCDQRTARQYPRGDRAAYRTQVKPKAD